MPGQIWKPTSTDEIKPVLQRYDINPSTSKAFANTLAHTNQIYKVEREKIAPIVIRAVNPETYGVVRSKLPHLQFEIQVLDHLAAKGFRLTPRVLRNRRGESVTTLNEQSYLAFNLMPGNPIGNFNDLAALTPERRESLFLGLGQMSKALSQFHEPPSEEKTLLDLCQEAGPALSRLLPKLNQAGKELLVLNAGRLERFAEQALGGLLLAKYPSMQRQPVHFDLHAGNVLFEGNKLTAVLDWDWCRLDCRISDLASCLAMCCYVYGGSDDGLYLHEQITAGAQAFRQGFGTSEFSLSEENGLLRAAFKAYVLIQFIFTLELYVSAPTIENLVDLQHFSRLVLRNDFERLFSNLA